MEVGKTLQHSGWHMPPVACMAIFTASASKDNMFQDFKALPFEKWAGPFSRTWLLFGLVVLFVYGAVFRCLFLAARTQGQQARKVGGRPWLGVSEGWGATNPARFDGSKKWPWRDGDSVTEFSNGFHGILTCIFPGRQIGFVGLKHGRTWQYVHIHFQQRSSKLRFLGFDSLSQVQGDLLLQAPLLCFLISSMEASMTRPSSRMIPWKRPICPASGTIRQIHSSFSPIILIHYPKQAK